MSFLYQLLLDEFGKRHIAAVLVPNSITKNLKPEFVQRPYQTEAFQRFILCYKEDFQGKPKMPFHLLYNMATGSGKTFVMAGLILYLYECGYRNFLFFVNSNNIIEKTKNNFLNRQSSKYLFNDIILINGLQINVKETTTFEISDDKNINIKFTTIQQLHYDLNNTRENGITFEDFKNRKVVLIADEAHHLSSATKSNGELFGSWEGTVLKILNQNLANMLLEFTATLDYECREILDKYQDKVIFKYDLGQFRVDKYSKEINLIRSQFDENDRILQAVILSLYRQELAASRNINLKPVVLFKAKKTIKQSEQNKINFHKLVEGLSVKSIETIRKKSTVSIVQRAFRFFDFSKISSSALVDKIKVNFKEENCISANNDREAEQNQISLNTLEDEKNPIRAVFAVQKLNEGWDVLNLFDIVRLYEGRDGKENKPGKTTISEAQLIGRGARYFPFALDETQDRFTRKYDDDPANDLRVLEELYFHAKEDSRYISELKKALIESGIYEDEDRLVTKQLVLKLDFKETDFYKNGKVVFNRRIKKSYNEVKSLLDLGVSKRNFGFTLSSGAGKMTGVFRDEEETFASERLKQKDIKLKDIPRHVVRHALSDNPFFYFCNLEEYIPKLQSLSEFIDKPEFMGSLTITFAGTTTRLLDISNEDFLQAVRSLLETIELQIKANLTEYEGSEYQQDYVRSIFRDKEVRVPKDSERADGQEELVAMEPWYVYNANYGTSEEKAFVSMFARRFESIGKKFKDVYLIRNERELKLIDRVGRAFEPDYILFAKEKGGQQITYQVFIEPKGDGWVSKDRWKEEFLKEVREEKRTIKIETDRYLITGLPFFTSKTENEFKKSLDEILDI